jgi:hypothetical protein
MGRILPSCAMPKPAVDQPTSICSRITCVNVAGGLPVATVRAFNGMARLS